MKRRVARVLRAAADRLDPPTMITGARLESVGQDITGLSFQFAVDGRAEPERESLRAFLARALRAWREQL